MNVYRCPISAIICGVSCAIIAAPATLAAPANVYVICENNYKTGDDGDSFNIAANAEAFKAAGFFGNDGAIFRFVDNDVKRGGEVVGAIVRDNMNRVLYYRNPNDTVRVYPVSSGPSTVDDAWLAVANEGKLTIATHAGRGTIVADRNRTYQGFKCTGTESTGTNRTDLAEVEPPLGLTPRKDQVNIDLNGCFTSVDPDDDGPQRSDVSTAFDVCGVSTVTGNSDVVTKNFNLSMGGPADKQKKAFEKLDQLAGRRGLIGSYFGARSLIKSLEIGRQLEDDYGIVFKITSSKVRPNALRADAQLGGDTLIASVTTSLYLDEVGPSGAQLVYPRSPEPAIYTLDLPSGALNTLYAMLLHPAAIESSVWPAGRRPAATACRFGPYSDSELVLNFPAELTISVPRPLAVSGFYHLVDGTLIPLAFEVNTLNSTVSANVGEAGVYAVFEVPPSCPGDANADGLVDSLDLSILLATYAQNVTPGSGADFNADGVVNTADLSLLLAAYYQSC